MNHVFASVAAAAAEFRSAAMEKGDFATSATRDHVLHRHMGNAIKELDRHGPLGNEALRGMLSDESPHVQS